MHAELPQPVDVRVFVDADDLGRGAAGDIAEHLRALSSRPYPIRVLFAAAPSQEPTLRALLDEPGMDWSRIVAFHLDEYVDLAPESPQSFGAWLRRTLFDHVPLAGAHFIDPSSDPVAESARYGELLRESTIDVAIVGIGVNGHLAFNDPPADLDDPDVMRVVQLDLRSRQQQVDDGLFPDVEDVPARAITATVPTILSAERIFCLVSGEHKAAAVSEAIHGEIHSSRPASALRTHDRVTIYLDEAAAANV